MEPLKITSDISNAAELPNSDKQAKELTFSDYLNILRRHKWGIVSTGILGVLLGVLVAMKTQPQYEASLTLLAEPSLPRVTTGQPYYSGMSMYLFYKTQEEIIKSRKIAKKVVHMLELDKIKHSDSQIGLLTPEEKQRRIDSQISMVQGGLFVSISEKSKIFKIRYVSHDPQLAADITNAVARAYIEFTLESRLSQAKHSSSWFTKRIEELRKNVLVAESVLQDYQTKEGMVGTERSKELEGTRLLNMNQELRAAQTKYSELAKRYGIKHPKLILAKADLEEAKKRFLTEEKKIVGDERKVTKLVKLERDLTVTRQLYDLFVKRFKEVDITSQDSNTNIRILDEAQVPAYPFKPDRKKIVLIYLFGGLFFGIMLSILRERLDNTFKVPEDIEEKLGQTVLGTVPLIENSKKEQSIEFLPERHYQTNTLSMFAESINHIRTSILFSQIDKTTKTILVTSSVPGEGKTTTSSNLALSFSRLGRTLLVDADMRKPRVG
ncbi:MAG TPA: hypothetical protein ENI80_05345, partial [Acidiferrobacteraceae bacterium]|nr:hypothetical protein [Acidiferrobacteraceae bacterium]